MQYYVHWYFGNKGLKNKKSADKNWKYSEKKATQFKITNQQIIKSFKKALKNANSSLFKSDADVDKFLKDEMLLLSQTKFQNAVDEAFTIMANAAPFFNFTDKQIMEKVQYDAKKEAANFNSELENLIRKMVRFLNNYDIIMNDGTTQRYLAFLKENMGNSSNSEELYKMLKQLEQNNILALSKRQADLSKNKIKELRNEDEELAKYVAKLNSLIKTNKKTKELTQDSQKNIISYIKSLFVAQGQKAGDLVEIIVTDVTNAVSQNLANINIPNIKVTHTGTKVPSAKGPNFAKYTSDIILKTELPIPSKVSIKRYKSFNNEIQKLSNVHLKKANLGTLLDILEVRTGLFHPVVDNRRALYNILANHRRHVTKNPQGGGGGAVYEFSGINKYYHELNRAMLVPAIAGSLTAEDFSTLFLINGEIYSIVDIITRAVNTPDSIYGTWNSVNKEVRAKHRWQRPNGKRDWDQNYVPAAKKRSQNIIKEILNSKLQLSLNLSLAQLQHLRK